MSKTSSKPGNRHNMGLVPMLLLCLRVKVSKAGARRRRSRSNGQNTKIFRVHREDEEKQLKSFVLNWAARLSGL